MNNTFCIGAPKCATTSLFYNLIRSSAIVTPAEKEPTDLLLDYDLKNYSNIEYPVLNFQTKHCLPGFIPDRIEEVYGLNSKVILMMRNPIDRAYSELCHFRDMRPGRLTENFFEVMVSNVIDYIPNRFTDEYSYIRQADRKGGFYEYCYLDMGAYVNHIERFSRFEILPIFFEDYITSTQSQVDRVCDFIGINRITTKDYKMNSKSDGGKFDNDCLALVNNFYKPLNEALSDCLGIDVNEKWGMK